MFPIWWLWLSYYERTRGDAQKAEARARRAQSVPDVKIKLDANKAVEALDKLVEALKRADTTGKG